MEKKELREAAYSASLLSGADRIEFIMNSYPNAKQQWHDILNIADRLRKDNRKEFMCKYNGTGKLM